MRKLGVAVVGFGWMGQVHSGAYTRLAHHYPDLPLRTELVAVVDSEPDRTADAIARYGFTEAYDDWRRLIVDPRIEVVSVTSPNFLHREIGAGLARSGKHIWIEKPVGLSASDAQQVAAAVAEAGVQSAVGFNYRNAPAVEHARDLIAQGAIGRPTHARFRLFSDYAAHPQGALSWRFERGRGGSGVLGDLVSHGIDLVYFLLGEVSTVVADSAVFITERPRPAGALSHFARAEGGELSPVENEDYLGCLLRGRDGVRITLEASRTSVAEQCNYGFEVHGSKGLVRWDFRRMGELEVATGEGYQDLAVQTVFAGRAHGDLAAFQPGAGITMGYDDLKVIEAARFVQSIEDGKPRGATVADAVRSALALEAMAASVRTGSWVRVQA